MARTPTLPPTEPAMWRKLLARVHPDGGGDHELFIWVRNVQERVCGRQEEPPPRRDSRSDPPRIPFDEALDFGELTEKALAVTAKPIYARLLRLLEDCVELEEWTRQQTQGATYRTLAAVGHMAGMTGAERAEWYKLAESIPLSQRHAGHILSRLKEDG